MTKTINGNVVNGRHCEKLVGLAEEIAQHETSGMNSDRLERLKDERHRLVELYYMSGRV